MVSHNCCPVTCKIMRHRHEKQIEPTFPLSSHLEEHILKQVPVHLSSRYWYLTPQHIVVISS